MNRKILAAFALLIAAIPSLRWYIMRLQDGSGEMAGLVPLAAAAWFAVRDRKQLAPTPRGTWLGVALLALQAATYPFLPAMVRAMLMIAALVSVSGIWSKPGIVCLLVLALPWAASMDFFLGYPLRVLTSINAGFLLEMTGTKVARSGVQLLYEGRVVGVDPACSGMNLLWSTGLLTALLAAVFSLRWRNLGPLGLASLALALTGNSLRAALLFFPEAGIVEIPHLLHPGIGVVIAGGCFFILMKLARKFSSRAARPAAQITRRPAAVLLLCSAGLLVFLASLFSGKAIQEDITAPPVLTSYQGSPITRIPLSPAEKNFYGNFPGSVSVYESADFKLIVRQVNRATRKLHPASHCLRAEGFLIGKQVCDPWLSYTATRGGDEYHVEEHVSSTSTGETWAEINAWFWHAFFRPDEGPWEAVTVIRR